MKDKYYVTGIFRGKRVNISLPLSRKDAYRSAKKLKKDMNISIGKYAWIKKIKVKHKGWKK